MQKLFVLTCVWWGSLTVLKNGRIKYHLTLVENNIELVKQEMELVFRLLPD